MEVQQFRHRCNGRRCEHSGIVQKIIHALLLGSFLLALCDGKLFLPETVSRLTDVLVCDKMLERLLVDRNPVVHGFHDVRHTQGISDDRITQIVDHIVGEL